MAAATITDDSASTGGSALGQYFAKSDLQRMHADDAGAGDKVAFADRQHFGARDARRPGPGAERDGHDDDAE